jgi:hypothetical protein
VDGGTTVGRTTKDWRSRRTCCISRPRRRPGGRLGSETRVASELGPDARSGRQYSTHLEKESLPMKMNKNLGMVLLSLWLILHALISFFNIAFTGLYIITGGLALLTGIVILFFDKPTA